MTTLTERKTVGEIAAEAPATVRVFQKYNIDFCCGGKLPLSEACRSHGIDTEALLAELSGALGARTADATNWNAQSLGGLIDHIVAAHHGYLKAELPRLAAMMTKVLQAHGPNHGESLEPLAATFEALKAELDAHLQKEELILFPLIKRMEAASREGAALAPAHCGSVNNPIRVMEYEHDNAGQALARMRTVTSDYTLPEDACNTYRALFHGMQELETDLHQHIHLENNVLFPRAASMEEELS
ncbi:MAG: iron-sulfur cluster repair di-iron protein [Acidobacteria bacterium]|nr:iron-sulfur cluster repair di-iron protein [Acidobacteriota bacterium]